MPISGKHFDLGIDSAIEEWMRRIHSLLVEHKDKAFTKEELAEQLMGAKYDSAFEAALEKLMETRAVVSRIIRVESYYRVGPNPLEI